MINNRPPVLVGIPKNGVSQLSWHRGGGTSFHPFCDQHRCCTYLFNLLSKKLAKGIFMVSVFYYIGISGYLSRMLVLLMFFKDR